MQGRIAGIIKNDFSAAPGICLTVFVQGCPKTPHCKDCHNPETWNFDGGKPYTFELQQDILESIKANGITRNFCIMGGEPCCAENVEITEYLLNMVKINYPSIKTFIWTGYLYEELKEREDMQGILSSVDFLIDGPFVSEERDITLFMRGSRNQRIMKRGKNNDFIECSVEDCI